jgi:Protein of unknown function (DUF4058)
VDFRARCVARDEGRLRTGICGAEVNDEESVSRHGSLPRRPAFWPDFHFTFINYWREHFAERLPEQYEARVGEHVYIVDDSQDAKKRVGRDVMIARTPRNRAISTKSTSAAATIEPVTIPVLILDPLKQPYIELIHRPGRTVVAILELLSPTNKAGEGREIYLIKRNALICQRVHLVELDLLLGGRRLPLAKPLPLGDYYYLVTRSNLRPQCEVYAWNLADRLPSVPVPLQAPDGDVLGDLGPVFLTAYERGRYGRAIDYNRGPKLRLNAARKKWVLQQVRAAKP